jgi:hypothetical protein
MGDNFTTKHVNDAMNKGVAEPRPIAKYEDLKKVIPVRDNLRYVTNDTYIADLSLHLGRVYYEQIGNDTLIPFIFSVETKVNPQSKLSTPQTIAELIVDSKMKAKVEALSLLSGDLSAEELLEVRVINNASARVEDRGDEWDAAIKKWLNNPVCQNLINDASVGTISVVTGVVQKYLSKKKYKKFEAGAKGGSWGVNVEGNLYTSTSQFELSVVYGVELVTFKRAKNVSMFAENIARGVKIDDKLGLMKVNEKFDKMAMSRASIFRIAD